MVLTYSSKDLQALEQVRRAGYLKSHNQVLTTRCSQHRPEVVEAALDACLAELELDYLDVCSPTCSSVLNSLTGPLAVPRPLARRFPEGRLAHASGRQQPRGGW